MVETLLIDIEMEKTFILSQREFPMNDEFINYEEYSANLIDVLVRAQDMIRYLVARNSVLALSIGV